MNKKIYACYRLSPQTQDPFDIEFWSFRKDLYDEFVHTYEKALKRFPCKHAHVPYTVLQNDLRYELDTKLGIFMIEDTPVISTQFYMEMLDHVDVLENDIIPFVPGATELVQKLPKRLQRWILCTGWNRHAVIDDIDQVKLHYIAMQMYFAECEFQEVFDLPRRLI